MAFAVIMTGGKQYKVEKGDVLTIEKLSDKVEGDKITFDKVLLVDDGNSTKIGAPHIAGAKVTATLEKNGKHKTVIVAKYRPKSRYFKKRGHRQHFLTVKIDAIA